MAKKAVLAIGLDPAFADYSQFPDLNPAHIRHFIGMQMEHLRAMGYDAECCLIDLGDTAEAAVESALRSKTFDCIVIGAGLREMPGQLFLFEKILNVVHGLAPQARIAFNTTPADTSQAVLRWLS
jgi:hypothetical protein